VPAKLPLLEISIVAWPGAPLPASLENCGYRGQWLATTPRQTLQALFGRLLPNGTVLENQGASLKNQDANPSTDGSLEPSSNWSRVFGPADAFSVATELQPVGLQPVELLLPQPLDAQLHRGESWLLLCDQPERLANGLRWAERALRQKRLGWLSLYCGDGSVRQWHRRALRSGLLRR